MEVDDSSALSGRRVGASHMPIGYKENAMQMNFECKVKPFTDDARGWGGGGGLRPLHGYKERSQIKRKADLLMATSIHVHIVIKEGCIDTCIS